MIKPKPRSLTDLKVLIVEDEGLIAEEIRERLQRLGAKVVDVVDNGPDAIAAVESEHPELILMDIRLKGEMTGVQAAEIIQSRFRVPLVYLTAHSDWETVQQAKSSDPFGYLLKPFNEADLVSTIETASRRQELEQRLSYSEKRFKATLDSLDEGVITVEPNSTVSFFNPMAEKLTGWSAGDVLGRPLREVFSFSQSGAPAPEDEFLPFLNSDTAVALRGTLHSRLGRDIPLRLTVAPIVDSASRERQRIGAVLTFQDLTEQLQIGEQMRHSEERVAAVFNNSPAAMSIISLDKPGLTLDVNQAFVNMTGYSREQALSADHGKSSAIWQAESDFLTLYDEFIKHGKITGRDFKYRHANGEIRAGLISASPFTIDGNSYVLTSIMDITDRKRTEELLRQSEEKFHAIFNQSFQFIGLLDTDGVLLEANETSLSFADLSAGETIGKPFWETPWWTHSQELQGKIRNAVHRAARGELVRMEVTLPDAEGREHHVDFSLKPVRDADGSISLLILEGRDVTKLKEMQTSLQVSEAEKSELQANYLQSQKMEAVGRLAAGVAHDFNNLLTVINGYADLIDQGAAGGGEAHQLISEIRAAGQRASGLTRQLLAFSRKQVLEPVRVDLPALIKDLGNMLERLLGEDVILSTNVNDGVWPINVDPNQLEQVVVNLAVNARDAMSLGGTLSIEAENVVLTAASDLRAEGQSIRPGHYVVLRVSDNGCGMEQDILGHIFEPFFTTKDQAEGTGLGLATVYGVVKQSGGAVRVNSKPNRGTSFELFFPGLAEEEIKVSENFETRDVATGSETILVVEDDEGVRELMTAGLSMLGYKIHSACNGQDALSILSEHNSEIGLMVTDVVMPGMSGGELAELTRERHPDIKVLFLSGYNNDEVVRRGITQGDIRLLRKPFTIDEFSQVVREELDA